MDTIQKESPTNREIYSHNSIHNLMKHQIRICHTAAATPVRRFSGKSHHEHQLLVSAVYTNAIYEFIRTNCVNERQSASTRHGASSSAESAWTKCAVSRVHYYFWLAAEWVAGAEAEAGWLPIITFATLCHNNDLIN